MLRLSSRTRKTSEAEYVEAGGIKHSFLKITSLPSRLPADWLSAFLQRLPCAAASVSLFPISREASISIIDRFVVNVASELLLRSESGKPSDELAEKLEIAKGIGQQLRSDETRLFYASIMISVGASSAAELGNLASGVASQLKAYGFGFSRMKYRQQSALNEFSSGEMPSFDQSPVISTSSIPALIPLTQSPVMHRMGTFIGINCSDGTPVIFDRFSPVNFNSIIVGKSGSGKSFFAKTLLMRESGAGSGYCFVIDPLGEFFAAALNSGGNVIDTAAEGVGMGSMKLLELASISGHLLSFLRHIPKMTEENCALIVNRIAAAAAQTPEACSTALLDAMSSEGILSAVQEAGLLPFLFGGANPFSARTRLTVFDLGRLNRRAAEGAIGLVSGIIFEACRKLGGRKTMIIDEAWAVSKDPSSAKVMAEIMRHSRHINLGVILISQNFDDFINEAYGETLLNNCSSFFIFRHERLSERMTEMLELSEEDMAFLSGSTPRASGIGRCLLFTSGMKLPILLPASSDEMRVCSSDGGRELSPYGFLSQKALLSLDYTLGLIGGIA